MHACYPMCLPIYTSVYIQKRIIGTDCIVQSGDGAKFTQSLYTYKIPAISPHQRYDFKENRWGITNMLF